MGESLLRYWAAQADVVANSSDDHDAMGWDFFLSWKHAPDGPVGAGRQAGVDGAVAPGQAVVMLPADLQPPPLRCLVQVKASDRRLRSWGKIPVSHWKRFVEEPMPCFFLVLEFDGQPEVQRAHLIHVGGAHAYTALERVRKLSVDGQGRRLHRHDLTLTWSDADRLDPLDGDTLRARIEAAVGPDLHAYVAAKTKRARTVGYEHGWVRVHGRVSPPPEWSGDPRDLLLDFQLGLVPYLEMTEGEVVDTRFGIDAPLPDGQFTTGRVVAQGVAPLGEGRVRFAAPGIAREVDLRATVRVVHDLTTPGRGKARWSSPVFDTVVAFPDGGSTAQLHFPDARKPHPLGELRDLADVVALALEAHARAAPVTVSTRLGGEAVGTGRLEGLAAAAEPFARWASVVRYAWTVAVAAGLPPTTPVVVADLRAQYGALEYLAVLLRPTGIGLRWETTLTQSVPHPERLWCMPTAVSVRIGEYTVQLAASLIGPAVQIGTGVGGRPRYRVSEPEVRQERHRVYAAPEVPEESDRSLYVGLVARYATEMNLVASAYNSDADEDRGRDAAAE